MLKEEKLKYKTYINLETGGKEEIIIGENGQRYCSKCNLAMNINTADVDTIVREETEEQGEFHDINVSIEVLCCPNCYKEYVRQR